MQSNRLFKLSACRYKGFYRTVLSLLLIHSISVGAATHFEPKDRPIALIESVKNDELKKTLLACKDNKLKANPFSIGHRGAPLYFPEHSKESYLAAVKSAAGIIECDVTFTKDKQLVCRHSQCDLHRTTDILLRPNLAKKCQQDFMPANDNSPARAMCCTSDITLAEFKTLCARQDKVDTKAQTAQTYLAEDSNSYSACGTPLSHKESIEIIDKYQLGFTPELKSTFVEMPYQGDFTQQRYASQLIDEYVQMGIEPSRVWLQSFNYQNVLYWIEHHPRFRKQVVYLDDRVESETFIVKLTDFEKMKADGLSIIAPPMWALVTLDSNNRIIPSDYALLAKQAGLKIITWTLERSGDLSNGGGWYYQSISSAINTNGDTYTLLDVLAQKVGVLGVFSDWPATTSFYANCLLD
ncbi:glycerophosphodiester phosphodiesterase [Catenovulum sp. SM1970]|uniref:glycerophosphodiester phosphodiesterase family protein n=1 Tax=Marinifaba aquimaris TaxID=2741323 RepID=UPI001572ACE8|nr:glycerophosphodiester phosphodiesterase family protein [Marinifaba aquimaris]NTS78898.1 glycerophosphodiester phosphodiesterase [Marinifaba aquimaris]